jgi:hypothetical protein
MLAKVSRKLAEHEVQARFYWERASRWTVLRLRAADPTAGSATTDALWLLGNACVRVNMPDRARGLATSDQEHHATSAGEAQRASPARG